MTGLPTILDETSKVRNWPIANAGIRFSGASSPPPEVSGGFVIRLQSPRSGHRKPQSLRFGVSMKRRTHRLPVLVLVTGTIRLLTIRPVHNHRGQ